MSHDELGPYSLFGLQDEGTQPPPVTESTITTVEPSTTNPRRQTSRHNAGVPPQRLNNPIDHSTRKYTRSKLTLNKDVTWATKDQDVASIKSNDSNKTNSENARLAEIEAKKVKATNALDKQHRDQERQLRHMEIDQQNLTEEVAKKQKELDELELEADEDYKESLRKDLDMLKKELRDLNEEIKRGKINLEFDGKDLEDEKKAIEKDAEVQKIQITDAFSDMPKLTPFDKKASTSAWAVAATPSHEGGEEASSEDESEKEENASKSEEEEDTQEEEEVKQLTKRLTKLKKIGGNSSNKSKTKSPPQPESSTSNFKSFQQAFATAVTQAMTASMPKSDKLLARQVQGRDLPIFSGRPEEWPLFISAFETSTKTCQYSDAENLPRLLRCLRGEAALAVQCTLVNPSSVPIAIEKLRKRYGRPQQIIEMMINKVRELGQVRIDKLDTLVEFGIAVDNLTSTIKTLKKKKYLTNPTLLQEMLKKLPYSYQVEWIKSKNLLRLEDPTLEDFSKWVTSYTDAASELCPLKSHDQPKQERRQGRYNPPDRVHMTAEEKSQTKDKQCMSCNKKGHRIQDCQDFAKKSFEDKNQVVRQKRLCYGCLNARHMFKDCRSKKPCKIQDCGKMHHQLLHPDQTKDIKSKPKSKDEQESTEMKSEESDNNTVRMARNNKRINHMVLPALLRGPLGEHKVFVVLDGYANITTLSNEMAYKLGLKGRPKPLTVSGFNSTATQQASQVVSVTLTDMDKKVSYHLQDVRTADHLNFPKQSFRQEDIDQWRHLKDLNLETYENVQPDMMIGMDNADLFVQEDYKVFKKGAPAAVKTPLGWVVIGKLDDYKSEQYAFHMREEIDDELHQLVKGFFTTESFGTKPNHDKPRSRDDIKAQEILDSTLKRIKDGWECGLLWRDENPILPESRSMALKRLHAMERKMDRDPEFSCQYNDRIEEYITKGFARKLSTEEANTRTNKTFYIPHFMVFNPKKPKKYRLVFDAAAKAHGKSLNDFLLQGPDKLTSLPGVLLQFRQRPIALTADIKDMFHRVHVRKEDACAQRFLWRGTNRDKEPEEYQMDVFIFGGTCSPSCAQEAKNTNSAESKEEFPEAHVAIIERHFVDDYLDSCSTHEEAIQRYKQVLEVQRRGGFHLCNWLSNNREVIETIPEELRAKSIKNLDMNSGSEAERVLGLFWIPEVDCFTFSLTFLKAKQDILQGATLPTKLEILSLVMSIYDPLGFLATLTMKAKIIIQWAWRLEIGWNDQIPTSMQTHWNAWLEELKKITDFRVPRCFSPLYHDADDLQLHIFCDASQQSFGTVAYLRIQKNDEVHTALTMAKSRVAPLKTLSVPRLELQGSVMGSRLGKFIQEHLVKMNRVIFWTDSSTVLDWIRTESRRFQQFVGTRVGEIHELTDACQWRWVPTELNPADLLTRIDTPCDWSESSVWINGPSFLKDSEDKWPTQRKVEKVNPKDPAVSKEYAMVIHEMENLIDATRFSSWSKLIKFTATFLKSVTLFKNKSLKLKKIPFPNDVEQQRAAEITWWKLVQLESFGDEIKAIRSGIPLPKSSRLLRLNLYIDDNIMRVRGRLENATAIGSMTKRPIVLDSKHHYTKLMINHYHQICGHHGHERVINEIRQKFWIPGLRVAVKKAKMDCQQCKNASAKPTPPMMGQLPLARLQDHVYPFQNSGLDYFGPVEVIIKRSRVKRWVALFTCLSTRAVHLELVNFLSTDSCIMAIRRFIGRRGAPLHIYSDNGTNFHGTVNELKSSLQELNQNKLKNECQSKGITWHFNPPAAPHMGGSWERLVRSVKTALGTTLKQKSLTDEVLSTVLVEAEHTVNSHPLTNVPDDPDEPEALTPNHFLLGRSSNLQQVGVFTPNDLISRKHWRTSQHMANCFWKRWIKEYLPTLLRRQKWNNQTKPIKEGDIVVEVNEGLERNTWPKGRVIKTYPGKDGIIRVVDIRLANGHVFKRPVSRLCILDVQPKSIEKETSATPVN